MLAAVGKVESDHGRVRLPGVRSGSNWAGACGPMQIGCVPGSKAGNAWARYGRGRPHDPADAIPAAARYLVDHGARRNLDRAIFAYNHSWSLCGPGQAAGPPLRPWGWPAMTLVTARCVPRRGRSRPRPARAADPFTLGAAAGLASPRPGGFVQAAVDAYARSGHRPPWLSDALLAVLEGQGRLVGVIYLLHFDRPIGDLANPRGFAGHYTGWTLNLPGRLVEHAAGRGARLMQVVGEAGIGWQLARIWPGTRARERSLKRSGGAARRCPVCQLALLGLQPPGRSTRCALELGPRAAAFTATAGAGGAPAGGGRMTPTHPHPAEGGEPMPASQAVAADQRGRGPAARAAQDRHPLGQRGPPGAPAHPRRPPPLRPRADRRPRRRPHLPALTPLSARLEGVPSWPDAPPG